MKKTALYVSVLMFFLVMVLAGCSKSTGPETKTPGDPDNPVAMYAQGIADSLIIMGFLASFNSGMEWLDWDGSGSLAKPADTLFLVMHGDFWYEFHLEYAADGQSIAMVDSFRFEEGDIYQEFPDSNTTALEYRARADMEIVVEDSSGTISAYNALRFSGVNTDEITVNGSSSLSLEATGDGFETSLNYSSALSDIMFLVGDVGPGEESHPFSGTMALTLSIFTSGQMGDLPAMSIALSLTVTFYENGYHARMESGDNYWEWEETWEAGPT